MQVNIISLISEAFILLMKFEIIWQVCAVLKMFVNT